MDEITLSETFEATLNEVINDLVDDPEYSDIPESCRWLRTVLEYNLKSGKHFRGLTVVQVWHHFSAEFSLEALKKSCMLGWCVEILHSSFLIADDLMDGSTTRRGQPCWYRVENVGVNAINDTFMVEICAFHILKKHFGQESYYSALVNLFYETVFKTGLGQSLDLNSSFKSQAGLENFTMDRYKNIVKYKTSYYSFVLPFLLPFVVCKIDDKLYVETVKKILLEVGYVFQMQDDMLDCFGDPEVTGKEGTDIIEGKCTWLIVRALEKCNQQQRKVLEDNYGNVTEDKKVDVDQVKGVYRQLDLEGDFKKQEIESGNKISILTASLPDQQFQEQFYTKFLRIIQQRKK